MSTERDEYGFPGDPAERMQQAMLGLFDVLNEVSEAGFSPPLLADLAALRLRFVDEFERQHPGYGKGRAVWR